MGVNEREHTVNPFASIDLRGASVSVGYFTSEGLARRPVKAEPIRQRATRLAELVAPSAGKETQNCLADLDTSACAAPKRQVDTVRTRAHDLDPVQLGAATVLRKDHGQLL